jgi:serine/threonine protein kinase
MSGNGTPTTQTSINLSFFDRAFKVRPKPAGRPANSPKVCTPTPTSVLSLPIINGARPPIEPVSPPPPNQAPAHAKEEASRAATQSIRLPIMARITQPISTSINFLRGLWRGVINLILIIGLRNRPVSTTTSYPPQPEEQQIELLTGKIDRDAQGESQMGYASVGTDPLYQKYGYYRPSDLIIHRYRVIKELGRGGLGIVYLAQDTHDAIVKNRLVAVKVMKNCHFADIQRDNRLAIDGEIKTMATLRPGNLPEHPNIIKCLAIGQDMLVYEYIDGPTLAQRIEERLLGRVSYGRRELTVDLKIMLGTLSAVAYAHAQQYLDPSERIGVAHLDLSPDNIMYTINNNNDIETKVLDWGLIQMILDSIRNHPDSTGGKPEYMAPERMAGSRESYASPTDIYSFGIILYEALSGSRIFSGRLFRQAGINEIARHALSGDPLGLLPVGHDFRSAPAPTNLNLKIDGVAPLIIGRLEMLIIKMVAKNPLARPTAGAIKAELQNILNQLENLQ